MTSTMGCRTASPSSSTNRMMVVTVAGAFRKGQRAIAIPYSRLAQTLQTMRRMGCNIVGVTEANAAASDEAAPSANAKVTPMKSQTPQASPANAAEAETKTPPTRSPRRRTSAKTQPAASAKPKPKRTTRSKRKRATG
ncbi:MAG: phycobilisome linker polypeptide [Cyanobacteria bacterium J06648_11]